jgi:hypothetical protein
MIYYDLIKEQLVCDTCNECTPLQMLHEYNASSVEFFDFGKACIAFRKKHQYGDCLGHADKA